MEKDYVSYELSLALKAAGFNEPCDCYYDKTCSSDDEYWHTKREGIYNWNGLGSDCQISVPTLWQAQKWLREVKDIDVLVWNCACGYGWEISKADPQSRGTTLMDYDDKGEDKDSGMWLTYENALAAGIAAALQLLYNEK